MVKHIFIFEGPAGAGKSTMIESLRDRMPFELIKLPIELPRPREYGPHAPLLSQLKDVLQILSAVQSPQSFLVMDRFFISQLVYQSIRVGDDMQSSLIRAVHKNSYLDGHMYSLIDMLNQDLDRRELRPVERVRQAFMMHYIFLLPQLDVLIERRKQSGKEYPFDPKEELDRYKQVYLELPRSWKLDVLCSTQLEEVVYYMEDVRREMME